MIYIFIQPPPLLYLLAEIREVTGTGAEMTHSAAQLFYVTAASVGFFNGHRDRFRLVRMRTSLILSSSIRYPGL